MSTEKTELDGSSSTNPLLLRLQQTLTSCSKSIDGGGDLSQSQTSVSELVNFLDSVSDPAISDPENEVAITNALEVLSETHKFLCSTSLDQEIIDALSFELPKSVSKFAGVSPKCLEIADNIIDRFVETCSPRDMLSILCERRHFEQIKVAVPVIVKVVKAITSESDYEDSDLESLFDRVINIADSIQAVSSKLASVSISTGYKSSSHLAFGLRLASFLPYCGLSYLDLLTGSDVDKMSGIVIGEDEDDNMSFLSDVYLGASLSVIWAQIYEEVAQTAKQDLIAVKGELQNNQTKRWQAIGMLKNIFSSIHLPWDFKRQAVDFLLSITNGNVSEKLNIEHNDCSLCMTSLFSALQVLADIPDSQRFDIMKALITNSDSPSMIAILLDLVRGEMHIESTRRMQTSEVIRTDDKACKNTSFWSTGILELVESVLRPPKGGPPVLPENGDVVLSALNLYRFVLVKESAEKTNYTGVMSKNNLQKAYNEWLLPLRTLVTGIAAENKSDYDQLAIDTVCALNPVEMVLYRCIELVEEKLKHST
ncbi:YAP-binding/Alf4/Glomulin [Corchorus olitorius]|uniref:YAP-binding/Alf4/Glomulin n=1 Tax=Corchorus olitorius TaxID=93759 RepID=A0A1R3J7E2_9ROSI|nr:YAP-binding/Alf4/Glomulin [Corchorus olitorius]